MFHYRTISNYTREIKYDTMTLIPSIGLSKYHQVGVAVIPEILCPESKTFSKSFLNAVIMDAGLSISGMTGIWCGFLF